MYILQSEIFEQISKLAQDKTHLNKILKHTASDEERFIHNQAKLRIRFNDKFPHIIINKFTIIPPRINCEQSSSFATSKYKSNIVLRVLEANKVNNDIQHQINQETIVLDATCGFGLDSYGFAEVTNNVISLDINKELIEINNYNTKVLSIENITFINSDFISYLNESADIEKRKFDLIYLDPSRRDNTGNKVFKIEDLEPNIFEHYELLKAKTDKILVKFSPLIDISYLIKSFENLTDIYIVEYDSELKEILILIDFQSVNQEIKLTLAKLNDTEIEETKTILINKNTNFNQSKLHYSEPLNFIYEPSVCEMKLAYWEEFGNLSKLSPNTNLFTSINKENEDNDYFGKFYEIIFKGKIDTSILKQLDISKANIKVRNSSLTVEQAYKKLKLKHGGEHYIFLIKDLNNQNIMLITKKF